MPETNLQPAIRSYKWVLFGLLQVFFSFALWGKIAFKIGAGAPTRSKNLLQLTVFV